MKSLVTCTALACLVTSIAFAQDLPKKDASAAGKPAPAGTGKGAPPLPKAPDWTPLNLLMGTAQCEGTLMLGGAPRKVTTTVNGKTDLDNIAFSLTCEEQKTSQVPTPFKFKAFGTYDDVAKDFNFAGIDTLGNFEIGRTKGLEGTKLILDATMNTMGQKLPLREIIEKKSDKEYRWSGELTVNNKTMLVWDWTCRK